jgi:hypothetical protein
MDELGVFMLYIIADSCPLFKIKMTLEPEAGSFFQGEAEGDGVFQTVCDVGSASLSALPSRVVTFGTNGQIASIVHEEEGKPGIAIFAAFRFGDDVADFREGIF